MHTEGTYTWRGHAYGGEVHPTEGHTYERTCIQRGSKPHGETYPRMNIHTEGHTRRGHTYRGERTVHEGTYDIHTEKYTYGGDIDC